MPLTDLTVDFSELVRDSLGTIEFKARFWAWLDAQKREGALAPLLSDVERHWSPIRESYSLSEARDLLRHISPGAYESRVDAIRKRFGEVTGAAPNTDPDTDPDTEIVLLVGLERPEGYSRFDRGKNTIFIGLDHPTSLAHKDHLEIILSHEMLHARRDPHPVVLGDYGGSAQMTHEDFVSRYPFREHLVSEALATSLSKSAYPNRPDQRYVYFEKADVAWCEANKRLLAERMIRALQDGEPYRTFYSEESVAPGSPECCDYWFGFQLGEFALSQVPAHELIQMPATEFLSRFLQPFLDDFVREQGLRINVDEEAKSTSPSSLIESSGGDELSLPSSVREVYGEYTKLAAAQPELLEELERTFADSVEAEKLQYAGEPWPVHSFPMLLGGDEVRYLRWASDGILRLVERVIELYRDEVQVRQFFRFPKHIEELCLLEPGFRPHVMLARADSYWSGRRVRFLEINVNGTAGWKLAEFVGEAAMRLPTLGPLLERYGAEACPLTSRMFEGLMSAWKQARGPTSILRRMAIVDWQGLSTSSEQVRLASDFTKMGVLTDTVSPDQLSFDGKTLEGPQGPIDLVYRRLTALDLLDRHDELGPLLEAAKMNAVVTVGSYASDIAHSKRLFAFLTHEKWQGVFSPEERSLINAHVPWTRMFIPGRTQFEGRSYDLSELALQQQERFVLKPSEGFEGRGVLLGRETDPSFWEAEVTRRFGGGEHIIQEIVQAPLRRLLIPVDGRLEEVPRWLHLGEFMIQGELAGFLARASQELVLNVDSNERTLPCLVLEDDKSELDR